MQFNQVSEGAVLSRFDTGRGKILGRFLLGVLVVILLAIYCAPANSAQNGYHYVVFEKVYTGYTMDMACVAAGAHHAVYSGNSFCEVGQQGQPGNRLSLYYYESCGPAYVYSPTANRCIVVTEDSTQKGAGDPESCAARSALDAGYINFAAGNEFKEDVDYQSTGTSPLKFSRFYNSIGGSWRHSFSTNIRTVGALVVLTRNDGRELYFSSGNGVVTSTADGIGSLQKVPGGWVYTDAQNAKFSFDALGKMTRLEFLSGLKQDVTYKNENITVFDSFGRTLVIAENSQHQHQHQPLSMSAEGINITYTYDEVQRLKQLQRTFVASGVTEQRSFSYYGSSALLTSITDERGVAYALWAYDSQGRITSSSKAGGSDFLTVRYNDDGSTTVTNEFGKNTHYRFQVFDGIRRIVAINGEPSANCPASNSTFTYNDRGQVLTQTDAKGFITTHTYNDQGLETTRTEATGTSQARTTTTTWHATFNLPLTVTEGGQVTTYTYDTQGRQTSRTQTAL